MGQNGPRVNKKKKSGEQKRQFAGKKKTRVAGKKVQAATLGTKLKREKTRTGKREEVITQKRSDIGKGRGKKKIAGGGKD